MADKLPLVLSDSFDTLERLQSGDVPVNHQGTLVYAGAVFATDNTVLRADGTDFGSQTSVISITDLGQLFFGQSPANVIIGYNSSGGSFTTGQDNMLMGGFCGPLIDTGVRNMLIGGSTGANLTSGHRNTAIGFGALNLAASLQVPPTTITEAVDNVAIGNLAGIDITIGSFNTFIGSGAGDNVSQKVDAVNSTALGSLAFTTADNQVVIGNTAITENILRGKIQTTQTSTMEVSGTHLPVIEILDSTDTLTFEITAFTAALENVAIGTNAGRFVTTAANCVMVGFDAGANLLTGGSNVFIGRRAGRLTETGTNNIFVGRAAGSSNETGISNICIGSESLLNAFGVDGNVCVGDKSGRVVEGSLNVFVGSGAGNTGQSVLVNNSIALGANVVTTASNQMILGDANITDTKIRGVVELKQTTTGETSGGRLPILTILDSNGVETLSILSFLQVEANVVIGRGAGGKITTADNCVLIGSRAGEDLNSGADCLFVGSRAGLNTTTAANNFAFGTGSLQSNITGVSNTAMGTFSLILSTGLGNIGIGELAGGIITSGNNNVFIGRQAGGISGQAAAVTDSIAIGFRALTTKNAQVVLGRAAITETILRGQVFVGDGAYETLKRTAITGNLTVSTETLVLADATSGEITVTLPPAADLVDTPIHIKKIDASAFAVIIDGDGSETIDDQLNATISDQYTCLTLVSDGAEWWIL